MAEGSDESPLDLSAVLSVLESDKSSDEQMLDAYTKLSSHINRQLSLFERDFVAQGRRLVAVTKKHVTSDGDLKHSIAPKALSVMSYCVHTSDIVSQLSAVEMGELVSLWSKVITETKEKFTCAYAFSCVNSQRFPANVMVPELPPLMNAFCRAAVSWWGTSTKVEQTAIYSIQRLGEQCPKEMKSLCSKWGPPYLRLLVSQSAQIREHAYSRVQKWCTFLASSEDFLSAGMSTVTKQIVPALNAMFANNSEGFALKTCTLLMQIFRQELQNITLINSLLTIQERAFRCSSTEVRFQAFQSWSVLIGILSDKGIHKKQKFVELIMRVFKTRNANTEKVAVAKLNSWWRYVLLMGPAVWLQFDQILKPLLQFCLGNARLGMDSGSSLNRVIHDPFGDGSQVTSSVPGSPVMLPVFAQTQQGGLVILTYLLQDADHPATEAQDLKPLEADNSMPLSVCIKNAHFLVSTIGEVSKLFAATHETQVMYVWERMTAFILVAVEKDRDDSNAAVSSFLSQFQALASAGVLSSKMIMKVFKLVCSLPADVLSAPTLVDGSLFKCRSHSLCELLLSSSILTEYGEQESFVTLFMTLVRCGTKHPGSTLPFLETVGKLLDSRASAVASTQVLWRLWSYMAHVLQEYISATNQVDQDDGLWPNFGCLYTVLLLPVTYLLGPRLPQTIHKSEMRTLTDLYHTFARLAAMVTTAEDNIVIEEFSQRILSKVSAEDYEKDLQTLEHLLELCQIIAGTIDFSSLTSANPFMKGIRTTPSSKPRSSPKPLGNLHSFVCLLSRLMDWVLVDAQREGDKSLDGKQKSSESSGQLGSCCSRVMEILTVLMTSVTVSSLVTHLLEVLVSPMATLFSLIPKKLPAKICTSAFTQKLDRLWQEVCTMLRNHYKGQYDSDLLQVVAPLLQVTFVHARRSVKNQTVQMWNATFGAGSAALTYPPDLQGVLAKTREKTQLSLPGWSAVDVALIDESPVSQMSQMDSQAPEPLLPGMPSPVRLRGSFLNRDVSPKATPKSASPKRVQSTSENRTATPSARKRLPLESLPQKDFVVISGTPKRRRVLTEHQKEVLKEKRALPAMYNNLEASQDVSLMAHFSSENTQQDSILDRPTVDDVIVVNSSQSQAIPDPEPVSTAQPSQEKPEEPVPRRSSRRVSVRFQEAREDSQSSDLPAKKTSEESPVVVGSPEHVQQETKDKHQNSELAPKMTEENPEVITLTESSSQDMHHSEPTEKSLSLPTPQPNLLADTVEKLIDSSSSKDASQSEIPPSAESSSEKRETRSAVRMSLDGRRSFSASLELTHGKERRGSSLTRRTRSQETKSPQEKEDKRNPKEGNPYSIFQNWLKKSSPEEQRKEDRSMSEKSACEDDKASGEPVVVLEKQAKGERILVEESSLSQDTEMRTITDNTSVEDTSKKTSKIASRAGTMRRSTRRSCQIVEQPVVSLSNSPVDSEHSISGASSIDLQDTPTQHARFKLPPPVVCDEVASQGFPGDTDSAQTSPTESLGQRRPKRRRRGSVDESADHSHQEASSSQDKPSAFGFSGLLKQNLESESLKERKTDSAEEHKQSAPVSEQSPVKEIYDPHMNPTLRLTPLPRRSLRSHISDTPDSETDSEKLSGSAEDKGNGTQSSPNVLTDSPATFDPTKDSTLSEQTERSRKRKQQTPKKIADPSLLRRTPRFRRHKPNCSCCKAKRGSNCQDSTDQAKKPNKKRSGGELPSPSGSQSKVSQEKSSQNNQQSDDSKNSKTAQKDTAGDGSIKKHVSLSPQDVGEVTPEAKTNCTPHRQSTTERKKRIAKLKAASKLLGPSSDSVPNLDSESSPLVSQSTTKPQKWKKDVFDSKKEQEKDEDMTTYVYSARIEVSPTTTVVKESPLKNVLKEDTSGLEPKKSGVMFNTKIRSPPKLRLRQKKTAPSVETQSDGKTPDSQTKQKMNESRLSKDIVHSESTKEQELGSRSKTELKPSKRSRRRMTQQKKTSPTSPPRSRFSHSSLAAHSLVKSRKTWIRRYPRRGIRKENAGKEAEVSVETGSEAASEEALIEHYESSSDSSDETSQSKPQDQSPDGKGDKPEENQSSDNEDDNKHQESPLSNHEGEGKTATNLEDGQSDQKLEECESQENERENKPEEKQSLESENEPCGGDESENRSQEMKTENDKKCIKEIGMSEELSGSQGFEPSFSEKGTNLAVPSGEEEKAAASASSSDTSAHSEAEMTVDQSEDMFDDTAAEAISEPSTTSIIHIAHCDGTAYTEGEGSLDMFEDGPDSSPISSPFLQPFHSDGNDSMNGDYDSDAMAIEFSQELLESDFPHNQRGLEMEQESLTPAEGNEFIVETTEDQESQNTEESTEQNNTQSAQRSANSQERSSNLSAVDQGQETGPEETVEKLPVLIETSAEETVEKLPLRTETSSEETVEKLPLRTETDPEETGEKLPLRTETSSEETVEKLPLRTETDPEETGEKLPLRTETSSEETGEKLPPRTETSSEETGEKLPPRTETSSEETGEKLPVLQGQKLSKAELFSLLDQSDASTQEIIDYLQSRLKRKRSHHAMSGSEEDNVGTSSKLQKLGSSGQGPEPLTHDNLPDDLSTDASVVSADAMSCDEVDCPVSDSHAATAVDTLQNDKKRSCSSAKDAGSCVTSNRISTSDSTSNASSTSTPAVSASGISSLQDSVDGYTEEESSCKDSEETSVNLCVSTRSGSSHRCVPESESPAEIISSAAHSEPSTSSATESSEPCSSSALASSSRPESSDEAHILTSEKQCSSGTCASQAESAPSTCLSSSVDGAGVQDKVSQGLAEGSSLQPASISSPGILKKRIPDSPMDTPSATKKARRLQVSFANPIEVGGTPTCAECGGIPSCDKCRKPESEERKRPFRDSSAFKKRKERLRKSRLRSKLRLEEEASNRALQQSATSSVNEQSASSSQNGSAPRNRLSSRDMQSPSTSANVQSGASCSRSSQGPSSYGETRSQRNSESQSPNSYHSTQESQLDSANSVFPDLVECTDPLDSILPSITASVLFRGMHGLLLARGISTVGHLASLTECEVEKLPFMAPKTKTLRNALRNHLLKHQPPKSADKPAESGLRWTGIPASSFYKKTPKEKKDDPSDQRRVKKKVVKKTEEKNKEN